MHFSKFVTTLGTTLHTPQKKARDIPLVKRNISLQSYISLCKRGGALTISM